MSSTLHVQRVVTSAFCIICLICVGNRRPASVYAWIGYLWRITVVLISTSTVRDIGPGLAATTYLMGNRHSQAGRQLHQLGMGGWEGVGMTSVLFAAHIKGSIGVSTSKHVKRL
jgi:hypothetical protein